jgi:hypothetical protein
MSRRARVLIISMVGTFVVMRVWLYFTPDADLNVWGYNIHHLYSGILLITLSGIPFVLLDLDSPSRALATVGFGIGLGLTLDEWVYLIATDGSNASYLLPTSFVGGAVMVGVASLYALLLSRYGNRRAPDSP